MIKIIAIIFIVCLAVFVYLLLKGLKAGKDYDNRMDNILNGKYQRPKK